MRRNKLIALMVGAVLLISLLIYMIVNTKFTSFKIENSDYKMLNKDNFVNFTVQKLCDSCENSFFEEAKSINDYDVAYDLVKTIASASKEAKEDENMEVPQYMITITYAKEEEVITYTYSITISVVDNNSFWLYFSETDEYYICTIKQGNLIEYVDKLYGNY